MSKSRYDHGADIIAFNKKWRKSLIIEAKGEGKTSKNQIKHSAFYNLFGQIISRMNKPGNSKNRARIYAIAIPQKWEKTFKNKISKMKSGWKILKLKVFLVSEDGLVTEKPHSYFLKH